MLSRIRVRRYERKLAATFRQWFDVDPLPIERTHLAAADNLFIRALYTKTMEHLNTKQRWLDEIKKQAALIDSKVKWVGDEDVVELLRLIRSVR